MKAEHDEVLGPETDPFKVALKISADPKILARLDYTLAVMKEVLRLRPIGDGVRYPPKGYIIRHPNGAEFDTTGMILSIQHQGLQMKEDVWGPNSRVFDPERFMPGKPVPVAYMPFAQRPRDCIGRNLAYLEVRLGCTGLIGRQRLRWHLLFEASSFIRRRNCIRYTKEQ